MQLIDHPIIAVGAAGKLAGGANPNIPLGMLATLRARLVDANGEPAPPSGLGNVDSWRFVLAEDWDPDTVPCYLSTELAYDPATATWTIPLDRTRTEQALHALGTRGSIDIGCEIAGIPADGTWDKPAYVLQWTAKLLNRRDGDGVSTDPTTGERVANILANGNRANRITMTNDGMVRFDVGAETFEATAADVAAVLASGITAELVEQMLRQAAKIVSPNGRNVVDVTDGGLARHYEPILGWGAATMAFSPSYRVAYGDVAFIGENQLSTSITFVASPTTVPGYGEVWQNAEIDVKPDAYDPTNANDRYNKAMGVLWARRAGWHLWGPINSVSPTELRYFDGARFAITDWSTAEPKLTLSRGEEVGGSLQALSRAVVDSSEYHELAHKDDIPALHSAIGIAKLEIPLADPVVKQTSQNLIMVADVSSLVYGTTGAADVKIVDDVILAEMVAGVSTLRIRATIYPDAQHAIEGGTDYPVVIDATASLQTSSGTMAQYSVASDNYRLNGSTMLVDAGGVYSLTFVDRYVGGSGSGGGAGGTTSYTAGNRTSSTTREADRPSVSTRSLVYADELGSAATRDVPEDGNASAQQVVLGNDSRLSNARPPTAHSHEQSDVTGLADALAGKAASQHSHAQSDVTGLADALAGKAASQHSHAQSDVSGLANALAAKASAADVTAIQGVIPADASASNKLVTQSNVPQPQLRYALVEPELTPSGTTVSATLQDRAVNAVTLASTVTAATFTFPAPVAGFARDFFLRLVIEGSTVPTISFLESGGGSLEDAFDADDDAWSEIEPGVNVLMFTETSQEAGS